MSSNTSETSLEASRRRFNHHPRVDTKEDNKELVEALKPESIPSMMESPSKRSSKK